MLGPSAGRRMRGERATDPLEVILQNEHPLDPRRRARPGRGTGASAWPTRAPPALNVRFVHHSPAHYDEQLAALRTIV